jgi:hypothetical protein
VRHTLSILLILVSAGGCSNRAGDVPPVPEAVFVRFWADKAVVAEEGRLRELDSLSIERRFDSLYRVYSVTPQQAAKATEYYQSDLPRWARLQELVSKRLEELSQQESAAPTL